MPFIKIYLHLVWSTKNRESLLKTVELRTKLWQFMREIASEKNIVVEELSGHDNHCHSLISLGIDQKVMTVVQTLKGESAYFINEQGLTENKFEWETDYIAVSVAESMIDKMREYIRNQEEHHSKKSYDEEYDEFITRYNFKQPINQ